MTRRGPSTALLLLLTLPALVLLHPPTGRAGSGDPLIETRWTVRPDGSLLLWPHPKNLQEAHEAGVSRPMFSSLVENFRDSGLLTYISLALSGTSNLASQCDAVYHFEKLGLGLADDDLVHRIATPPEELARTGPLLRRARLDRLLAVRLAVERGLRKAVPALRTAHDDPDGDPFLRDAAWDALARMDEPPRPFPSRPLPPLLGVLREVPATSELVLVANQARVPPWTGIVARQREYGVVVARTMCERLGSSVTWRDRIVGQITAEVLSEFAYEMARRYGNARVDHSVAAIRFADRPLLWMHWDGRFEIDRLREHLALAGLEVEEKGGALTLRLPHWHVVLTATATTLRLVVGDWSSPPGGDLLATELGLAGATRGGAVWVHLRHPPPGDLEPPLAGLTRASLVLAFEKKGIRLTARAQYAHEAAARAAARALERFLAKAPPPLDRIDGRFEASGSTLSVGIEIEAPTASEAMLGLVPDP